MKANKHILFLMSFLMSFNLHAKEIQFNVYDSLINKKVKVTLNTITGQYYVQIEDYFRPEYKNLQELEKSIVKKI